jgi:hypothetical protein
VLNKFLRFRGRNNNVKFFEVSTYKKQEINYMQYFFDETKKHYGLHQVVKKNLELLSKDKQRGIAIDILSLSFSFLRSCSQEVNNEKLLNYINFYQSVIWHLSDAVHNLPTHLNESEFLLSGYLIEFFIFLYLLEKLENKPLTHQQEQVFLRLILFKDEWERLYI